MVPTAHQDIQPKAEWGSVEEILTQLSFPLWSVGVGARAAAAWFLLWVARHVLWLSHQCLREESQDGNLPLCGMG